MRARTFLVAAVFAAFLGPNDARAVQDVITAYTALPSVSHLRFDRAGNLFVTERTSSRIIKLPVGGGAPVVFATGFLDPIALAIDSHDNLYAANYQGARVDKVTPAGHRTVFAPGLSFPTCVAVDAADNVYVGEIQSQDVFMITPGGVMTLYGNANLQPAAAGVNGFSRLMALGFDPSGNLFCGTYGNGTGQVAVPFALSVIPPGGGTGVRLPQVSQPILDFALAPGGGFFTAGYQANKIGLLSFSGTLTDYAGSGDAGLVNGPVATARFDWPSGVAVDCYGNLFIADWNNDVVREIPADLPGCPTPVKSSSWGHIKTLYR